MTSVKSADSWPFSHCRTGHKGSITMTAVQDETTDIDLGALLDASDCAIVTLVAGDTQLAAYRAVLAARSPVFRAMFQHDTLEAGSGRVAILDVEGPVLRQLLVYCYTLKAPQMPSMAAQLLAAADKYGLLGLKAEAEQQLVSQLAVENAAATAVLALKHTCPSLTEAAVAFIKGRTHQVMGTQAWADAVLDQPKLVVELSRLLAEPSAETRTLHGEEMGRRLIKMAKEGLVEELRTLLVSGADIEARDKDNMTALHWAAEAGHVEAVRCLLESKADVGARNSWKSTPLHYAAQNGHAAVVRLLLASSADPNAKGSGAWTPLHYAAMHGRTHALAALLDAGANKATMDNKGMTPMHHAKEFQEKLINMLT